MFRFRRVSGWNLVLFPGAALFDAFEQVVHAAAEFGGDVGLEMQFRDAKQLQADGQLAAQEGAGVFQGGERLLGVGTFCNCDRTRAWRLSGETSMPVTVAEPMRGSESS